jgi:tetrahydromethanopterin:alpha-L-glutamate ligase
MAHEINEKDSQLVIKPLFGSQGQGVRLVETASMPLPMDAFVDGVFYIQQFIAAKHDYRVFVVHNQAVAAMKRTGDTWLHNVAQGAKCENILEKSAEQDVLQIALQAALVLDIAYCGVDVIKDKNGKVFVLEVNSIPAWRGLQGVTEVNIAQILVDDFLIKSGIGIDHG